MKYARLLFVAGWLLLVGGPTGAALAQQPAGVPLQAVLDRIRTHAAGELWRKERLADPLIEAWLDKLAGSVAAAADMPDLKIPVRLADVQAADPVPGEAFSKALIVGRNIDLKDSRLRESIVLADGKVNLNRAEGCVIVARGPVRIDASEYCVVISGVYVEIARFDGQPGNTSNGSLIVSRGWANLQSAYGSLVAAPEGISASSARNAQFVNAALVGPDRSGSRTLRVPDLPLETLPAHPLAAMLKFEGIVRADGRRYSVGSPVVAADGSQTSGDLGIVVRHGDHRYVAEVGKPITDEAGQPVEALRDWQVSLICPTVAIVSNATTDVPIALEGR